MPLFVRIRARPTSPAPSSCARSSCSRRATTRRRSAIRSGSATTRARAYVPLTPARHAEFGDASRHRRDTERHAARHERHDPRHEPARRLRLRRRLARARRDRARRPTRPRHCTRSRRASTPGKVEAGTPVEHTYVLRNDEPEDVRDPREARLRLHHDELRPRNPAGRHRQGDGAPRHHRSARAGPENDRHHQQRPVEDARSP